MVHRTEGDGLACYSAILFNRYIYIYLCVYSHKPAGRHRRRNNSGRDTPRTGAVLRANEMSVVKSKPTATAGPGRLLIFVLPSYTRDGHSLTPALCPGSGGRRRQIGSHGPTGRSDSACLYTSLPVTISRSSLYKQYTPARRIFHLRNPRRLGYLYLHCCADRIVDHRRCRHSCVH